MYRICKIAKRTALYLIQHNIVPVIDTGKKTWRYQVAIDDIITYIRRREQVGSMIPPGAVTDCGVGVGTIVVCGRTNPLFPLKLPPLLFILTVAMFERTNVAQGVLIS